jgi:uncharacterized protein YbaA (DUF1428 family)
MSYVDGFLIPVPKAKLDEYRRMARQASEVYVECIGDDVPYGELTSFPRAVQARDDEVVIFSWAMWPSREARDAANEKIMKDPRLAESMNNAPFDGKRMIFGGFEAFIEV